MNRIATMWTSLDKTKKKGLIPYITAGDPSAEVTLELMKELALSGADLIELGMPFSDPMADGPTIQKACHRALSSGMTLKKTLDVVAKFRQIHQKIPVVLMGYLNTLEAFGIDRFADHASAAGVDGILIVDCPYEEAKKLFAPIQDAGLETVYLVSPTTKIDRCLNMADQLNSFLYYVSMTGVTGSNHLNVQQVVNRVKFLKEVVRKPLAVGFGIRDGETAVDIASVADAVVIGSRLVQEIENSAPDAQKVTSVGRVVKEIRDSLDCHFGRKG